MSKEEIKVGNWYEICLYAGQTAETVDACCESVEEEWATFIADWPGMPDRKFARRFDRIVGPANPGTLKRHRLSYRILKWLAENL